MRESALVDVWRWLRSDLRRFDLAVAIVTLACGSLLFAAAPDRFDTGWPELAAGAGAFVLVLFRRWRPLLLLCLALAWTAVHVAVYERPTPTVFAIIVLLITASIRLERWAAIALGVVIGGSLYVFGLVGNDAEYGDARAVIGIAWTAMAVGIGDAIRSWRRYRATAEEQLRSTFVAAEANTRREVTEERLAIARELHDLLAHSLSVMNVQTGAALHVLHTDPERAEASLVAARDAGKTVLEELREMLAVLRHDDADDDAPLTSLPTVEQLPDLVETVRDAGVDIELTRRGEPQPLAPTVSLAAYRIAQEALTNVVKHGTGSAEFALEWDEQGLTMRVRNRMAPRPPGAGGHGLIGMEERAAANGGTLTVGSHDGTFTVDVWLPAWTDRRVAT